MSKEDEIDLLEETDIIEKPSIQKKKKAFENPAPKVVIKKKIAPVEEEEEDEECEEEPKPVKPKRERTQKQIDAFNRCIQIKKEKAKARAEEAARLAEQDRIRLEEKVVKKAISIKKKAIKKQIALDEISDDDEPMEVIKEKAKKVVPKPVTKPEPAFKFV